ncbi:MAG: hypothetical protein FRX48_04860 [Lasallia pustulata]|uniref:U3 snoRNA associated n=1 Tax=Lasallia pustulata TaxID=136370 RepID=A0A5M8PQ02_9LECA|nr:MAG: hypothetical protein FRX48_04860 [Lasallia pustulata]
MVTTRRQSHVFPEADLKDGSEIETPRAHVKKRKTGDDTDATAPESSTKRKRKNSASETIVVGTPVKTNGTKEATSAFKDSDRASVGMLESDSYEHNGRKTESTASNGSKPSVELDCDTKGPWAAKSISPVGYVENGTHKSQQIVSVVIEGKPADNENIEAGSSNSNKQTSSEKKGRLIKDLPVRSAATTGLIDDAAKTSIASSKEGYEKSGGDEVTSSTIEQPNDKVASPTQALKKQAQTRKASTGIPEASQTTLASKTSGSVPRPQLDKTGSTRSLSGEHEASMTDVSAKAPKANHKRFASEEPKPPPVQRPKTQEHSKPHDEDDDTNVVVADSDDDAPETLTASAGLEQVRATAIEAARAVEKQEATTKEKRKARDTRLKEQAKSASKRRKIHRETLPESDPENASERSTGSVSNQPKASTGSRMNGRSALPALLPDEIIAIEPAARPPTPPEEPEVRLMSVSKKRKFLDADPKPPKDVKRGPVTVRVLEAQRQLLPPRASKTSKALKEAWLVGRRGAGGAAVVQRRKLGGGFVRK